VLINTGIRRVFYSKPYKLERVAELVRLSGIQLEQVLVDPTLS